MSPAAPTPTLRRCSPQSGEAFLGNAREINASSNSAGKEITGCYRLIAAPEESDITVPAILTPHRERSVQRIRGQRTVLAIRDGTDLSFSTRPGCDGLEVVGTNQTGAKSLGLSMHANLAVTETGLPLGVLDLNFDTVLTGRQTRRWLDGLSDVARAAREVTGRTRVGHLCL